MKKILRKSKTFINAKTVYVIAFIKVALWYNFVVKNKRGEPKKNASSEALSSQLLRLLVGHMLDLDCIMLK